VAHGAKQVGQPAKSDHPLNIAQSIQYLRPQLYYTSIKMFFLMLIMRIEGDFCLA
jgi:hypothetical protein